MLQPGRRYFARPLLRNPTHCVQCGCDAAPAISIRYIPPQPLPSRMELYVCFTDSSRFPTWLVGLIKWKVEVSMKSKLRLVAASLALLLGISGAAFAQPVGYNRNTRNEASYRGYANTSAWGYQNGRQEQDRAYQRTDGDRDDRGY